MTILSNLRRSVQRSLLGSSSPDGVSGVSGGNPPANTVAPVISGPVNPGQVLTCTTGTWTGDETIAFTYQWRRDGANISGATASTHTLVYADAGCYVDCRVTGTNDAGNSTATSNELAIDFVPTPANLIDEDFAGATTDSGWTTVPTSTGITLADGSLAIDYGDLGATNKFLEITGLSLADCRVHVRLSSTVTSGIHTVMQLYAGATLVGQLIMVPASNHFRFDRFKNWSGSTGTENGITTSFTFQTTFTLDLTADNDLEVLYRTADNTVFIYCNGELIGSYSNGSSALTITKLQVGKLSANTTGVLTIKEVKFHDGTERITNAACAYKVAFLCGQSNAVGSDTVAPDAGVFPSEFLYVKGLLDGTITESNRFITQSEKTGAFTSNKLAFDATRVRTLPSGYTPCILEVAKGGTGFTSVNDDWATGNGLRLYVAEWMETRLAKCVEKYRIDWFMWQQGETDAAGSTGPEYEANLTELIEEVRANSGVANLAVTCGGMTDPYITENVSYQTILAAIVNVCDDVPNCGFVDSQLPTPASYKAADRIHFDNAGLTTMGLRHADARALLV